MVQKFLSKSVYHILFIIVLGIMGYSNTLSAPFEFDDIPNIVDNPIIKNLHYYETPSKAEVHRGFAEYPMLINRYIGSLTFAINYKINKLDVKGYHIVNILIHLINSLMVYWFVRLIFISLEVKTGGDNLLLTTHASIVALFSSLIFVTHPIQTQAVTYIIQRFASLATMFYLISIIMYVKSRLLFNSNNNRLAKLTGSRWFGYYLISILSAVLAMKTKEIAFTLPVMIIIYELLFFAGNTKTRILCLTPFVLTMLIIPATLIGIVGQGGGAGTATSLATDMPRLDYLYTQFRVIFTYIRLVFFPIGQNLDYEYPIYHTLFDREVFLSIMALLVIIFSFIYSFWRYRNNYPLSRIIFFGFTWFFVTLSVESSVIPIVDVIFEHRMYLPSFGIFLVLGVLSVMIVDILGNERIYVFVILSTISLAIVFTGITYSRNILWSDGILLWQDVVSKSPKKVRALTELARNYEKVDIDIAINYYNRAISVGLPYAPAYFNLGNVLLSTGRIDDSINAFVSAININQSDARFYYNLGCAYYDKGLIDESIEAYKNAIKIDPSHASSHYNLSGAYFKKGLYLAAESEKKKSVMLQKLTGSR